MAPSLHSNFVFSPTKSQPQDDCSSCDSRDGKGFPKYIRRRVASSISSTPTKTLAWFQQRIGQYKKPNARKDRRNLEGDEVNTHQQNLDASVIPAASTSIYPIFDAEEVSSNRPCTLSPQMNRRSNLSVAKRPCMEELHDPRIARRTHPPDLCLTCAACFRSQPLSNPRLQCTLMREQHRSLVNSPGPCDVASPGAQEQPGRYSRDSNPPAPPIPWETRPKPKRPYRPIGECDAEIAMLNSPGLVESFSKGHRPKYPSKSSLTMPAGRPATIAYTTRSNSYSLPSRETNQFTPFDPRHDFAFVPSGRVSTARENSFYSVASLPAARQVHLEPRCRHCSSPSIS